MVKHIVRSLVALAVVGTAAVAAPTQAHAYDNPGPECPEGRICLFEHIGWEGRILDAPANGDLAWGDWDTTSSVVNLTDDYFACLYDYDGEGNAHLVSEVAPNNADPFTYKLEWNGPEYVDLDRNDTIDRIETRYSGTDWQEKGFSCQQLIPAGS